jgi:hypothetical protein
VVALGLGRTGTDYFMNNKQDKDLCLLELWCKVELQHLKSYPYLKKSKQLDRFFKIRKNSKMVERTRTDFLWQGDKTRFCVIFLDRSISRFQILEMKFQFAKWLDEL